MALAPAMALALAMALAPSAGGTSRSVVSGASLRMRMSCGMAPAAARDTRLNSWSLARLAMALAARARSLVSFAHLRSPATISATIF